MSNKIRKFALSLVLIGLLALTGAAMAQDDDAPPVQYSSVHRFPDAAVVEDGEARLVRFENGVTMMISTNGLTEGDVYTAWWVVFNEPENCSDGVCGEDDIFVVEDGIIPRDDAGNRAMNFDGIGTANIAVIHASGQYVDDGSLAVSASLGEGDVPGILFGPGLLDAEIAEIHLVLRSHGPADAELFADQISTFGGGCEPMDALPCDDQQFAMFLPPAA